MAHKHSNQEYADIVLRTLYTKDIGVRVKGIDDLVRLADSKLDSADKQTLLNIVGSKEGLFGRGLVDCRPASGDGAIFAILDIELTDAGREYVSKSLPSTKTRTAVGWVASRFFGEAIGVAAGIVVGWLLRGLIRP